MTGKQLNVFSRDLKNVNCNLCLFLYLEQHFTEVVQGEEFLALNLQQVCSLISSDKLTVSTEEKVSEKCLDGASADGSVAATVTSRLVQSDALSLHIRSCSC